MYALNHHAFIYIVLQLRYTSKGNLQQINFCTFLLQIYTSIVLLFINR
jgi:hypothetical protein